MDWTFDDKESAAVIVWHIKEQTAKWFQILKKLAKLGDAIDNLHIKNYESLTDSGIALKKKLGEIIEITLNKSKNFTLPLGSLNKAQSVKN